MLPPSSGLKVVCSSEALVSTYKFTRRNNPEKQRRQMEFCFSSRVLCPLSVLYIFVFPYLFIYLLILPLFHSQIIRMGHQIFEVLTAVKISIVVFWVVTPCSLVGGYQLLGGTYRLHIQYEVLIREGGNHLQDHTASQPRRPQST
jgi:hypothetical protein